MSSVRDRVESTFMLSNVRLSLAFPPLPVLPPQEAVNIAAASSMAGVEKSFFFIICTCVVYIYGKTSCLSWLQAYSSTINNQFAKVI